MKVKRTKHKIYTIRQYFVMICLLFTFLNGAYSQKKIALKTDWQFTFGNYYNMQKSPPWQKISLPHSWNANDIKNGNIDYYRGLAVYKRSFSIAAEKLKKRYFLHFEGSATVTDVFVNGRHVGNHKGGFTAFTFEITDDIKLGNENDLLVKVNNAYNSEVMPLVGDFNVYGGLHRPIYLIETDQVTFEKDNHGSSGVFITQKHVDRLNATLEIRGALSNGSNENRNLKIITTITNNQGIEVFSSTNPVNAGAKQLASWSQEVNIPKPHLWDGRTDPYRYTIWLGLVDGERLLDEFKDEVGLRSFKLDADKGFFLNGEYLDLKGTCYHEAKQGKGSALTRDDYRQDFEIMMDMGVNAIRTSHYPQSPLFYEMCDSLGIVVYTEIPQVGPGGYKGRGFINSEGFKSNGKDQLKEMIRQNYNHPSIFFWGLYNELKIQGNDPYEYIKELHQIAKEEDPYRFTMAASNQENHNNNITDAIGWNKYFGWYGGSPEKIGEWADQKHRDIPKRPISVTEYGAGASLIHHSDSLKAPKASGKWHPEEWQAHYHEKNWEALRERPFVWGKFIWLMFDFGAAHRTEGDTMGVNDKGLVTSDRKKKKDAYYFYKANWNSEPMLHLAEKRFKNRIQKEARIKAYTNIDKVAFFLNEKMVGRIKQINGVALSPNIKLKHGENLIEIKGKHRGVEFYDSAIWTLK